MLVLIYFQSKYGNLFFTDSEHGSNIKYDILYFIFHISYFTVIIPSFLRMVKYICN